MQVLQILQEREINAKLNTTFNILIEHSGHSMKDDNPTATITGLNKCWDGDTFKRIRTVEGLRIIIKKCKIK